MLNIYTLHFNLFMENTYIAWDEDTKKAIIVDPGCSDEDERQKLFSFIEGHGIIPEAIFLTHGHMDHIMGVKDCKERYGIPAYLSEADREVLKEHAQQGAKLGLSPEVGEFESSPLEDGQVLSYAGTEWKVITTPGHSPGGVCFHSEEAQVIFTGDTLFKGTIGRSDLFGGDYDQLIVSVMDKVMGIDGPTIVYPGHAESTSISDERTHNPFLEPFNEPEQEGIDWDAEGIELDGQV